MRLRSVVAVATAVALAGGTALASGFLTNGLPQAGGTQYPSTIPLTGSEQAPFDTQLSSGANPQSEAISINQIVAAAGGNPDQTNLLIGGDASTNLFQRGTTGASETTTVAYGGPDRWAYWSGTNTAMTVSRDSTAADIPTGYKYAFIMQRTSGQTGVVQACMAQEVESVNSYMLQGQTVELDFHAIAGANFSAASNNITAYVIYGTGTDEGMSKMAWGLNAGGGGSTAWTGQTNAAAAVIPISTTNTRYSVVASIPTTATEAGVAICFTPVGTAGTSDYVALAGIQLVRNPANASYVNATAGYTSATYQAKSFQRRLQQTETALQQRYTYVISEGGAAAHPLYQAMLLNGTSTTCAGFIPYPVTMRAAPTYANALTASTFKLLANASGTMTAAALSNPFSAVTDATTGNGVAGAQLTFTASGLAGTVGDGCILEGIGGSGSITFSAEL